MWVVAIVINSFPSKNHKIPQNIGYFKTRVNTVIAYTGCKFYKEDIVA